jgi:hypothetical protein
VVRDDTIQKLNNEIGKLKGRHQEKLGEVQKQGETIRKLQEALTKSHVDLDSVRKTSDEEVSVMLGLLCLGLVEIIIEVCYNYYLYHRSEGEMSPSSSYKRI